VAFGVLVGLAWTVARVSVPALVGGAINQAIEPGDKSALVRWTVAIAAAAAMAGLFTGLRRYWAFKVSRRTETELRDRFFAHLQRLPFAYHDQVQTGDLMSRANTDLQQIQFFVVMIPLTISNFVTVVAVTVILFTIDPWLTVLALGSLPFVLQFAPFLPAMGAAVFVAICTLFKSRKSTPARPKDASPSDVDSEHPPRGYRG